MMPTLTKQQHGFTLVEMIMVIVITGIIGGMVAVFLKAPVQQYVDVARRAELTDIADTAVRRMARDVRTAVPNSVRAPDSLTFEYVQTIDGGRYRAYPPGNQLVFDNNDTDFEILHGSAGTSLEINDFIVIGSAQSDGSVVYNRLGLRRVDNYVPATALVTVGQGLNSTLEMPAHRFDVVDSAHGAVTYACESVGTDASGNGTGILRRYWGYWDFTADRTNWAAPVGGKSAILADKVSDCEMTYDVPNQRFGLLAVRLTLTSGDESVSLYNEIHVNNAP